jgi:hypothetical protein
LANSNEPAKEFGTTVFTKKGHDYLLVDKTKLHASLLFLMLKLEEAKSNPIAEKNFILSLTECSDISVTTES